MQRQLFRALALATATYATLTYAAGGSLEALFGPYLSPGAEIAESTDANFSSVVGPRWSAWETPDWSGAIKPATKRDIQEIVKIAVANNISFLPTNGGHGSKYNLGSFTGIDVNLGHFNTVSLDAANNLVTVGPGAILGDIMSTLYNAGKEIQTGNSWCPGVIGVTLGGGIGIMTGMYGVLLDQLQSVKLVTATGDVVTASKTENADLFWGIRGAGPNFGIVTEAVYSVHEQTNHGNLTVGTFYYAPSSNRTLWETLQKFDGSNLPAKLAIQTSISYNRTANAPILWASLSYFGTQAEAQPYLDVFAATGPIKISIQYLTQIDVYYQSVTLGTCSRGATISAYTLGLGRTDVPTLEGHFADMVAFYQANPLYDGQSFLQRYSNGVTSETPVWETAFPWRDVQTWWLFENLYFNPALGPTIDTFSQGQRTNLQATSGFSTPHVYVNYANGDEGPAAWWSAQHLPKLRALKAIWDPNNVFGVGSPIN